MLTGTRKLFGNDYKDFCIDISESALDGQLPAVFQLNNTFGLTFQDISDLYADVKKDTGLELEAHLFMCDECNQLHLSLTIDYPEGEEEEDKKYLQ